MKRLSWMKRESKIILDETYELCSQYPNSGLLINSWELTSALLLHTQKSQKRAEKGAQADLGKYVQKQQRLGSWSTLGRLLSMRVRVSIRCFL